ncbi:MAG: hypothetical protein QXU99_05400 [Candidatus Bathyarchaeia archaeon]
MPYTINGEIDGTEETIYASKEKRWHRKALVLCSHIGYFMLETRLSRLRRCM